jgi:ribosome biogenesis protein YTM1
MPLATVARVAARTRTESSKDSKFLFVSSIHLFPPIAPFHLTSTKKRKKNSTMAGANDNSSSSSDEEAEEIGEQIRVSFVLDSSVPDRSLQVPSEPIAIPADLKRKGLSAVINHLLDRQDDDSDDEKEQALPFDFIVANRLLRTGVEQAARRYGLSLEQAVKISYFPAQQAPEVSQQGEPEPDWIGTVAYENDFVYTGGYDGSIVIHDDALKTIASAQAHTGPIKCLATSRRENDNTVIATGSMDQTLVTHSYDASSKVLEKQANFVDGHTSSIASVDFFQNDKMVSGDWDGGLALWNFVDTTESEEHAVKKRKTSSKSKRASVVSMQPLVKFQAHSSQISGVSWNNDSKSLISGSWDHTLKVWDVERQESLLTLNGSRVISCLDVAHSSQVVATGHPDCTIRLWDVRTDSEAASSFVSDSSLKPSHKAWISAVKWSPTDPYSLASTSHDGTLKIWDIRSNLPLHTVRAFPKEEKGLCLALGKGVILAGGSDCVVKQFKC